MDDKPRNPASNEFRPMPQPQPLPFPVPQGIAEILQIVHALGSYACYLTEVLKFPVAWAGFSTVAQFFGTIDHHAIRARVVRGLMRLSALEGMLLQRAQMDRELVQILPRDSRPRAVTAAPLDTTQSDTTKPKSARVPEPPLTMASLPSQNEINAWVYIRPIGETIAAICLDLGVSPSLCAGPFWNRVFEAIQNYRGNLIAVVTEFHHRADQFESEEWKRRHLPWPEQTREGIRKVLGFFIGEDPFQPAPAAPAGPS